MKKTTAKKSPDKTPIDVTSTSVKKEPDRFETILVPPGEKFPPAVKPLAVQEEQTAIAGPLDMSPREFQKILKRRQQNRQILLNWIKTNLKPGIDYMRVWSNKRQAWSKPFLLKPGSEKILGMLGVTPTFPNLVDYEARAREGNRINVIVLKCELVNAAGQIVSHGVGGRLADDQDEGDLNKALKMAMKSSQGDATLRYGGLSEIFTQEPESETDEIPKTIDTVQLQSLLDLIAKSPLKPEAIADFYNVNKLELLPSGDYFRATKAVLKAINKAAQEAAAKVPQEEENSL